MVGVKYIKRHTPIEVIRYNAFWKFKDIIDWLNERSCQAWVNDSQTIVFKSPNDTRLCVSLGDYIVKDEYNNIFVYSQQDFENLYTTHT